MADDEKGRKAAKGDTVRVHYRGTLADGAEFDSSRGRDPIEFTIGGGRVIPGFDDAVTGMRVGEARTVTIPADRAYGARREDMVLAVPRSQFPPHITPEVGQQLQLQAGNDVYVVRVREVTDDRVVLDGNHPLAGEELTFAVELVEIR